MSRTKKSRKPATAPKAKAKLSKEALASVDKRVRKKTGKTPGNRQQEAMPNKGTAATSQQKKDPRIGSKTPIALGGVDTKASQKTSKQQQNKAVGQDAIAAIRTVNNDSAEVELSLAQQLVNIEADERLQSILSKQEDELALTEQEVDYYNDMMERHQQISAQLGEEEEEPSKVAASEDDLWNKLDNANDDFSQF